MTCDKVQYTPKDLHDFSYLYRQQHREYVCVCVGGVNGKGVASGWKDIKLYQT